MYVSLDRGGRILPNLPDIFADSEGFGYFPNLLELNLSQARVDPDHVKELGIPPSVKTLVLSLNQEDKFPDLPAFAELSTLSIDIFETFHILTWPHST